MAMDSAKSTSTTVSQAIKNRYYDKLFLTVAESKLVHKQLGQMNRTIPKGEGGYGTGVVYWTRWTNLPLVTAGQGEGVPTTAVSMTASNVTGSVAQYDAAVSISDILAQTSFGDVMQAAMQRLAYNAGLSIDTIVRNGIATAFTQQNAATTVAATFSAIPVTGTLSITEIRKAVRLLKRNDTMQLPDGTYVCVAHPDQIYDIMADSSTGGWIDANKYTEANAGKLLKGEVGKLLGARFLETTNGYVRGTGIVASASIYIASMFGTDAFGVTDLQNLKTFVKGFGSAGAADPTDKVATAGWKTSFGVAPLNTAFGVNINTTVTTTA